MYLDIGIVDNRPNDLANRAFVNVTSRLVAVTERGFHNGNKITCRGPFTVMKSLPLNYSRAIGR